MWIHRAVRAVAVLAMAATGIAGIPAHGYSRPGTLVRITAGIGGAQPSYPPGLGYGDGLSRTAVSGNGRYVAFASAATNLVPGDHNLGYDVFRRDASRGRTDLVSVGLRGLDAVGACPGDPVPFSASSSTSPAMSADGRYVAFDSCATNLVPGDTNLGRDVFVRDMRTGVTTRVSVSSKREQATYPGATGFAGSELPSVSADGRYVAFFSLAANLVAGDTNDAPDIFVHDRRTGRIVRADVGTGGAQAAAGTYTAGAISPDGRYLVFTTTSALAADDVNGVDDVYRHDLVTGRTELVSAGLSGGHTSPFPSDVGIDGGSFVSAGGRYVVFESYAADLVPDDTNMCEVPIGCADVFVRDLALHRTQRVSVTDDGGTQGNFDSGLFRLSISADGRVVAFGSYASNLVPGADIGIASCYGFQMGPCDADVFVYDLPSGAIQRMSLTPSGAEATCVSNALPTSSCPADNFSMSADGRYVAFLSPGKGFVPEDSGWSDDVFLRDRGPVNGVGAAAAATPATVLSFGDPVGDVAPLLARDGGDIVASTVAVRPALADVFVRLGLSRMPVETLDDPAIVYGLDLEVRGTSYEARAGRSAAGAIVELFRRSGGVWTPVAALRGGIGTTGQEVTFSLPLHAIGATSAAELSGLRTFSGIGTVAGGVATTIDTSMSSR
jgi:Tol biopolymer transport system component